MSRPTCRVRPRVFAASPLRLSNIPLTPGRQWLMAQCGRADRRGDLIFPRARLAGGPAASVRLVVLMCWCVCDTCIRTYSPNPFSLKYVLETRSKIQ